MAMKKSILRTKFFLWDGGRKRAENKVDWVVQKFISVVLPIESAMKEKIGERQQNFVSVLHYVSLLFFNI
jgi:hypothetical protein